MKKLILKNSFSPGDIVMLTAAVRDLHLGYPDQFLTDVRTSCPQLWEHNPYLTPLSDDDPAVEAIDCEYPLINRCNLAPYHCIHGFIEFLNDRLGLNIKPTVFRGDIHLSAQEKLWFSQVHELTGEDTPFWMVVTGGKFDTTVKWWAAQRYQEVIDHFRGRMLFVQVGDPRHYHPKLDGVIDLRGKTDLRQLVRLVYHAQGVLCPVTALMHLAAAVEVKGGPPGSRPGVMVAGGREPVHWEAYPNHQFIHTLGALRCCDQGGCWRSRTVPLGDGDERDQPEHLCVDVAGELPRCMDLITAAEVIRRIELYFQGGAIGSLSPEQAATAERAVALSAHPLIDEERLTIHTARLKADQFIGNMPACPTHFDGRGIVICAGGAEYFANAWVCVNMLRRHGCALPVQLWHLGEAELDARMRALVQPLNVACIDAIEVRKRHPARRLNGWELKPYAMLHSPFKEVLLLDADNVPLVDPEFLFETAQFQQTGAIFWPDYGRLGPERSIWSICGVAYRNEPEVESGQIVLDKERCWRALSLCCWYNEHSEFFYQHVHGDKETFHIAWRKLNQHYSMPGTPIYALEGTMCQHDFEGRRIFQHRNLHKWRLDADNARVEDFWEEAACLAYLEQLRELWNGAIASPTAKPSWGWTCSSR
ncbi:MAG: glycosyltransferase family 9 protein [Verrucomicrobiota bacterium]